MGRNIRQDDAGHSPRPGYSPGRARVARIVPWTALAVLAVCAVLGWALAMRAYEGDQAPPVYAYEVVNVYPHDPAAFCQGLAFADGYLYEGTGRYGASSLRQVDLESGRVLKHVRLGPRLFGEGIAVSGDDLIQLTWRNRVGFVYDKQSFARRSVFRYSGEGWGITRMRERLVMSDGSATLRFLDPKTFRVVDRITVRNQNVPVDKLNELEYVQGEIYANVWGSDRIARISPKTGQVLGWIDLGGLLPRHQRANIDAVLNGIAFDPEAKRLFVTGKLWPKLFEIRVVRKP